MEQITIDKALELEETIFVDVRTPKEFEIDNIPNSINIPIFSDEERKQVGIIYNKNPDEAFDKGLEYYSKKLPELVKQLKQIHKKKTVIIYCWRGGMRSKAITMIAETLGLKTFQLKGGYKAYREFVRTNLETFRIRPKIIVLWGKTGTAKTKIIENINPSLDLEGLAQHRSSLFGAVGLRPRTQKSFETGLFVELRKLNEEKYFFVEGESRKVGDRIIPKNIYDQILKGINVKVEASNESRVKNLVEDYYNENNVDAIREVLLSLKKRLGKKQVEELVQSLDEKRPEKVAEILLIKYYDSLYNHTIKDIKYDFEARSDDLDKCIEELNKFAIKT